MTNKYLEKIAEDATIPDILRGLISPAWQEASIAKEHGSESPNGWGPNYGIHFGGVARAAGRAGLEAAIIGAPAMGIGALVGGAEGAKAGQILGTLAGGIHGGYASLNNQANEAHNKYLHKVAQQLEDEDSQHPFRTALTESAVGIPGDIAGGIIGERIGSTFGTAGRAVGAVAGAALAGLGSNYAVLKHKQMNGY